jgi:hypothetical protein
MRKIVKVRRIMSMRRMTSRPTVRMSHEDNADGEDEKDGGPRWTLDMVPEMTFSGDVSVVSRRSPGTGE